MQPKVKSKKNRKPECSVESIKSVKERDELYIRFLLSSNNNDDDQPESSISTPPEHTTKIGGSLTSRLPSKAPVHSVGNRPSTAKLPNSLLGTFPIVSNQACVRKYVKPLRELHVLPSILLMEEKIGQMHMTNLLEIDEKVRHAESGVLSENGLIKAVHKHAFKGGKFNDDEDDTVSESSRASLCIQSIPSNLRITAPFPQFKNQQNGSVENNISATTSFRKSNSSSSLHQTQTNIKSSNSHRSIAISSAGSRRTKSKVIARLDDRIRAGLLEPPSLDAFFKPVVHPDGVFSTPTLDLNVLPTAKSSVTTFLGSLREKY